MTDHSALIGSLVDPQVLQPSQADPVPVAPQPQPAVPAQPIPVAESHNPQGPLGFATPLSMSSEVIAKAAASSIPSTPTAPTISSNPVTPTINQVLSTQPVTPSPLTAQTHQPAILTTPADTPTAPLKPPALIVNTPIDKTKIAAIAGSPSTITQETKSTVDLSNPLEPPVTYPYVADPFAIANSGGVSNSNAIHGVKIEQTTDLATLSTPTAAPYLQIDPTPQPTPVMPPVVAQAASIQAESVSPVQVNPHLQQVYSFVHFFTTVILLFLGLLGIYSAIRFIMVDFPAFEQSFNENLLGQETIMNFVLKAGIMLFATAISLFFTLHTNIFRRKEIHLPFLLASFFAVFLVVGLMYFAMTIQL